MAQRLHEVRPSLLVSESFGLAPGNPVVDGDPGFDFTTTHSYARLERGASANVGAAAARWSGAKVSLYAKPTYVGEFGCNDDVSQALSRAALHDGLCAYCVNCALCCCML